MPHVRQWLSLIQIEDDCSILKTHQHQVSMMAVIYSHTSLAMPTALSEMIREGLYLVMLTPFRSSDNIMSTDQMTLN